MNEMLQNVLRLEVGRQARFGLDAAADLDGALKNQNLGGVWFALQGLLIAAGNVSKVLWAGSPTIPGEREALRKSLGIRDDSPLASRKFRNHFEHFDERLEQWATSSQRKNFVDSNIGPPGMIFGADPGDCLRNFDPSRYAVTFWGETYVLQPVIDALKELSEKIDAPSCMNRGV